MANNSSQSTVWILIPARGGSKGIPRKNLRHLAGKPLIFHTVQEMSAAFSVQQVIVSTDDEEIAALSQPYATIHHRSAETAQDASTLDDVVLEVAHWLLATGAKTTDILLTVQPTSPFLKADTVLRAAALLNNGAKSIISVRDDRHLRWTLDSDGQPSPLYQQRVNRQWLPPTLAETGGIIGTRLQFLLEHGTRIVQPIALLELSNKEGLDIDNYADWAVAEYYARQKRVVIRADAGVMLGSGHVYRAIALAHEMNEHNLKIVTCARDTGYFGAKILHQYPYPVELIKAEQEFFELLATFQPHITVLDVLDTTLDYVQSVKQHSQTVLSLEDLGPGARLADIVINDLYTDLYPQQNHWYGVQYAILAPHFETVQPVKDVKETVKKILISFGGTDIQNFTVKALTALQEARYQGDVTVVLGPGYGHPPVDLTTYGLNGQVLQSVKNMALVMRQADLAITSAGRTVTELMTLGVPTLVLCQNLREIRHTHASSPYGVINLGLGEHVEPASLAQHILMLITDAKLRQDMRIRALNAVRDRSNKKVVGRILKAASTPEQDDPYE